MFMQFCFVHFLEEHSVLWNVPVVFYFVYLMGFTVFLGTSNVTRIILQCSVNYYSLTSEQPYKLSKLRGQ